jgi:hypothetical protein
VSGVIFGAAKIPQPNRPVRSAVAMDHDARSLQYDYAKFCSWTSAAKTFLTARPERKPTVSWSPKRTSNPTHATVDSISRFYVSDFLGAWE